METVQSLQRKVSTQRCSYNFTWTKFLLRTIHQGFPYCYGTAIETALNG